MWRRWTETKPVLHEPSASKWRIRLFKTRESSRDKEMQSQELWYVLKYCSQLFISYVPSQHKLDFHTLFSTGSITFLHVKSLYKTDNFKMKSSIRRTVFIVTMNNIYKKLPHTMDTVKKLIAYKVRDCGCNQIAARFVVVKTKNTLHCY